MMKIEPTIIKLDALIAELNQKIEVSEKKIAIEQALRSCYIDFRNSLLDIIRVSKTPETISETLKPRCSFCGGDEDYAGQHVHVISPKSQSPDGDDGRVQPGQKSQAEINPVPQSSDSSASGDISEAGGQDNPEPKEIHLPAEIIPFKEIPAFTYNKLQFFKQVGKTKTYLSGENIAIYHDQYKLNIFTSMDEIRRMKALSELEIKITITDYEKRTYQNKGIVLRHFLRELKSADDLKKPAKPTPIGTFSKLSELDDIKKKG